jgi:hypothetical protein
VHVCSGILTVFFCSGLSEFDFQCRIELEIGFVSDAVPLGRIHSAASRVAAT